MATLPALSNELVDAITRLTCAPAGQAPLLAQMQELYVTPATSAVEDAYWPRFEQVSEALRAALGGQFPPAFYDYEELVLEMEAATRAAAFVGGLAAANPEAIRRGVLDAHALAFLRGPRPAGSDQ